MPPRSNIESRKRAWAIHMLSVAGFEVRQEQNLYGESARSQDRGVKEAEDEQTEACDADVSC